MYWTGIPWSKCWNLRHALIGWRGTCPRKSHAAVADDGVRDKWVFGGKPLGDGGRKEENASSPFHSSCAVLGEVLAFPCTCTQTSEFKHMHTDHAHRPCMHAHRPCSMYMHTELWAIGWRACFIRLLWELVSCQVEWRKVSFSSWFLCDGIYRPLGPLPFLSRGVLTFSLFIQYNGVQDQSCHWAHREWRGHGE